MMAKFTSQIPAVKKFRGKEFLNEPGNLLTFFKYYLAMRLRKTAKKTYEPDADGQVKAKISYCKPVTLYNYVADIVAIATKYAKLTTQELNNLRRDLDSFVAGIAKKYGIKKPPVQKITLYKADARFLIQEEMKDPISIDVSLQFCNIIRLLSQVGSRPCGLSITRAYDNFAQVGDIKLYRMKDEDGRTLGFSMDWILKHFQGFQKDMEHEVPVCLVSPQNLSNLDLDAPTCLVAQFYRRGFFGNKTAAEVYDDPSLYVHIDRAFLHQPLFLKVKSKGVGLIDTEGTVKWKDVALRAGAVNQLISNPSHKLNLGQGLAGKRPSMMMGHQHGGFALQRHYDQGRRQINMSATNLRGENAKAPVQNYSKEYLRAAPGTSARPVTLQDLMSSDETLLELGRILGLLKECWKRGSHSWLQLDTQQANMPAEVFHHITQDELEAKRYRYEEGNSSISANLKIMFENGRRAASELIREECVNPTPAPMSPIILDGDSEDGGERAQIESVDEEDEDQLQELGLARMEKGQGSKSAMDVDAESELDTLDGEDALSMVPEETVDAIVQKQKIQRVTQWATDVSRAETTTYAEVREERRDDFICLCELQDHRDQSCMRCALDPTVATPNGVHQYPAKQFEGHGGSLFHSARNDYNN